ncbi:glutamate-5-semialdehyde dehydrogenase [Carboxylicivirga sp. M1479]|uniref:glutamate-5-semialdehyde dehydrogenase n=1 Tax=Carboxylicivirga sp. M1479 TaxID=2594476 RepID=UPI001178BF18|nr:glutamate-5-semialdehyde dehydrogenase [Carboxylicivirga sp. M1479]TRX72263.1 glutamate-5-semialdehyde dehydrogenase [Carboxylicivirga sp. M1479]
MYQSYFEKVKNSSRLMTRLSADKTTEILMDISKKLRSSQAIIMTANKDDLDRMDPNNPRFDRLKLSEERIASIASDVESVAQLPCPVGELLESKILANGLSLEKKRVALGVVGVIYEARPNVTIDVFALCLRSGNVCVLKGGADAENSNVILVDIIRQVLTNHGVDPEIIQLLPPDRKASEELMNAVGYVDVLIPRGSQGLIDAVRSNAKIPVIETGAGIVHTYFHQSGDLDLGQLIILNAKTRRVSVCNALDCLVLDQVRLGDLPVLIHPMAKEGVEVFADDLAYQQLKGLYPDNLLHLASDADFGTEFLSLKLSIKTVANMDAALDHIYRFSSKHSEAIIAEDEDVIERYLNEVDAAAVYVNASTAFTDGAQFGLGAEIGISTQKLHARGPMGLRELTSYKWIVKGNGQVRS